jgi:Concanavalin A-like lectin/glucanases superfamily
MALTDSLIAYWKLDETSGTRVDSHTGGYDLTDNNTVTSEAGIISNGASFNGGNQESLTRADAAALKPTAAMSFSCWFKPSSTSAVYRFAGKGSDMGKGWMFNQARQGGAGALEWYICQGGNGAYTAGGLTTTSWQHLVFVFDGSGSTNADRIKIYRNGTSHALTFAASAPTSIDYGADTGALSFGRWIAFGTWITGGIDEVGYWSRALTSDEVTSLYNGGAGLAYPFTGGGASNSGITTLFCGSTGGF